MERRGIHFDGSHQHGFCFVGRINAFLCRRIGTVSARSLVDSVEIGIDRRCIALLNTMDQSIPRIIDR